MSIRLACADFAFPLLPHDNVLDLIAALQLDGVDIGLFEGRSHLWPSREFAHLTRSARQLGRKLTDRGMRAADVFLQMAPDFVPLAVNHPQASRRRKARDWFHNTLEYAAGCGAKHVTTLPGVYFADEPRPESWARCCEELAWRVEQSQALGITFSVESHVGSIVPSPRTAERLVKSVPGLTLTLDYTHYARKGMPDAVVEPLLKFATHFHVRGARKGRLQTSFDKNTIDYRRIVNVMQTIGYGGWIGIEYIWIDWEHGNENDCLSETIRFRDFLRSVL
ncbi:MAG: sugar phosphate isomerase/epimerase family protein [Pirellulaceae bacterium]